MVLQRILALVPEASIFQVFLSLLRQHPIMRERLFGQCRASSLQDATELIAVCGADFDFSPRMVALGHLRSRGRGTSAVSYVHVNTA
jgi:hypothetical protein